MHYLVTGKEMRLLDQNTSRHFHVPELVLMEQAAMAFVRKLFLLCDEKKRIARRALIVCGSGNNGADGLAIARLLSQSGLAVGLWCAGEEAGLKPSASYLTQKEICTAYGLAVFGGKDSLSDYDLIVDAMFGIGLSRNVEGPLAAVIERINGAAAWRVAVDIASGLSADTGEILGCAFRADDTVTFSFGKVGQYLWPGCVYTGRLHIVPIGITTESFLTDRPRMAALEREDLALLPARRAHSNKGTYGKLLVVAGSVNMAGAACLCARAAYRAGTGLVRVFTPEENRLIVQSCVPEAILTTCDAADVDESVVADAVAWADAIVIGPGLGTDARAKKTLSLVLSEASVPVVADADALNLFANDCGMLKETCAPLIVTPHLGEMARLTGRTVADIQRSLPACALAFAEEYGAVCVLKDFRTVVAVPDGLMYLNLTGNDGMATAGSGDVLSGVIGGLLAQGMKPHMAAAFGVLLHGLAGDAAAEKTGKRALMAGDIADGLMELRL